MTRRPATFFSQPECQDQAGDEKTVIVLGAGRGGTSAVAGLIRELGVHMPVHAHPLKHEWSPIRYTAQGLDQSATRLNIEKINNEHAVWGWKSPKDFGVIQECMSYIRAPHFIYVFRNPLDVYNSMHRWEGIDLIPALQEITDTYSALMKLQLSFIFPCAFISYERMTAAPEQTVVEIANWLGISDNEAIANAVEFISSDGYRPLHGEKHSGETAEEELVRDRANSQTALYGKKIGELADLVTRTREDLRSAALHQQNLINLVVAKVSEIHGSQIPWRGILNMSLPEMQALLPDLGVSNLSVALATDVSVEEKDAPDEEAISALARVSEAAYRTLSSEFATLAKQRIELQQDLDRLHDKMIALVQIT